MNVTVEGRANAVAWYENGSSGLGNRHLVSDQVPEARSVYPADLDGDGDVDLLSAARDEDRVAWHGNTAEGFAAPVSISTEAFGVQSIHARDLTGDGNPDVLAAAADLDAVTWYKTRIRGSGISRFSPPRSEPRGRSKPVIWTPRAMRT